MGTEEYTPEDHTVFISTSTSPPPISITTRASKRKRDSPIEHNMKRESPTDETTTPIESIERDFEAPPAKRTRARIKGLVRMADDVTSPKIIESDFKDFGFSKKRTKELMSRKESRNAYGHRPKDGTPDSGGRGAREKRVGKGGVKYEHLYLNEGTNWVLFDPQLRDLPIFYDQERAPLKHFEAPASITRFLTFQPGNTRIVEYNIESGCVRLRSTPKVLAEGREVEYLTTGPRIVETKKANGQRKRPGRPRKHPVQVEVEEDEVEAEVLEQDSDPEAMPSSGEE